jgi:hypothetical protein
VTWFWWVLAIISTPLAAAAAGDEDEVEDEDFGLPVGAW